MKRSLLALAVLGAFAGTASAQSSVTIYGLLDQGVLKTNDGNSPLIGDEGPAGGDAWRLTQAAASRLGFRGNEDLGGGLSAQFQIEHRFLPDTGSQASTAFWQARSYVQLTSAAAGSIYLGREYSPVFWVANKSDPFGWDGIGQIGGSGLGSPGQYAGYATPGVPGVTNNGIRIANGVGYRSPNWGGLTIQGAVGLSETNGQGRVNAFNVEYAGGPIYAALGYESVTGDNTAFDGNKLMNFALHWDFGVLKLMGYYAKSHIGANGDTDGKSYSIGARIPVGAGVIKAAYLQTKIEPPGLSETKFTKYGIGIDWPLSKRTNVYADYGSGDLDLAGFDRRNGIMAGVKHVF